MYTSYPEGTSVQASTTDNKVTLHVQPAPQDIPHGVADFLAALGWQHSCSDPDTLQPLFQKASDFENQWHYFTWYEALAYEWFRVMSVGGS